jgi:hypothetical protein
VKPPLCANDHQVVDCRQLLPWDYFPLARHPSATEESLQTEPSCNDRSSVAATMRKLILFLFFLALSTTIVSAQQFDLVLEGGRVMDPETGLDAMRNSSDRP